MNMLFCPQLQVFVTSTCNVINLMFKPPFAAAQSCVLGVFGWFGMVQETWVFGASVKQRYFCMVFDYMYLGKANLSKV